VFHTHFNLPQKNLLISEDNRMGQLNVELIDCFLTGLLFSSIIYTIVKEIKFCKIDR